MHRKNGIYLVLRTDLCCRVELFLDLAANLVNGRIRPVGKVLVAPITAAGSYQ